MTSDSVSTISNFQNSSSNSITTTIKSSNESDTKTSSIIPKCDKVIRVPKIVLRLRKWVPKLLYNKELCVNTKLMYVTTKKCVIIKPKSNHKRLTWINNYINWYLFFYDSKLIVFENHVNVFFVILLFDQILYSFLVNVLGYRSIFSISIKSRNKYSSTF